jgi:hypothetical protein
VSLPLRDSREAARRLAGDVWRWFGLSGSPATPAPAPAPAPAPSATGGDEAAARIDAARRRLRSAIAAPDDESGE